MLIRLIDSSAQVEHPDDLRRLHVLTSLDTAAADRVLRATGLGSVLPDGRVALDIETLRDRATPGRADGWAERWVNMVAYAADHGWTAADGRSLIAHIETA